MATSSTSSGDPTEIELRVSGNQELRKCLIGFPAFLRSQEISVIKSYANRRPSAATPGAAGDGNSGRGIYSVSSTAQHGGERRANGQFAVNHPGCGARNNIGNTTGTSRADRPDESNLCAATPTEVAMR